MNSRALSSDVQAEAAAAHQERLNGDIWKAIAAFSRLHDEDPQRWHYELGICYRRAGYPRIARSHLLRYELLHGLTAHSRVEMALSYQATSDFSESKAVLLQALESVSAPVPVLAALEKLAFLSFTSSDLAKLCAFQGKCADDLAASEILERLRASAGTLQTCNHYTRGSPMRYEDVVSECLERSGGLDHGSKYLDFLSDLLKSGACTFLDHILASPEILRMPITEDLGFFTFWDRDPPPQEVEDNIRSWSHLSSCRPLCYSEAAAQAFLQQRMSSDVLACFQKCHHPAMKSDLFRLCRVHSCGGFYIDADERLIGQPSHLPELLGALKVDRLFVVDVMPARMYVQNHVVCAEAGDPILKLAIEQATEAVLKEDLEAQKRRIWPVTGPGNITRAIARHFAANPSAIGKTGFVSSIAFRNLFIVPELAYKRDAEKDWRNY